MGDSKKATLKVDAGTPSAKERSSTLLAVFDSLPPGESFVFSSRESPAWLLAALRAERPGQFDWTLDGGRPEFRVEISRRAAERGSLRRISEALGWDHSRLARLEVGAFVARAAGDTETAAAWYEAFALGLRRHIAVEERFLFPLFEERAGLFSSTGATDVMRREHSEALRLLGEILRTIGNPVKLPDERRAEFHEVFEEHHRKEEEMLYPALDHVLTPEENDALVATIQAFSG
jgi:uncharacterized protein (DUF2249 family)